MVYELKGNALQTDCDILCHQVNLQGVMGGGIAYEIANCFPVVETGYMNFPNKKVGEVYFGRATNTLIIANCFSQNANFSTNYEGLEQCLDKVVEYMDQNGLDSVAIPNHYGCGIASGNWDIVKGIFINKLKNKTLKIYSIDKN